MPQPIQHPDEDRSNQARVHLSSLEPQSLRTFTPSQGVFAKSAGMFHWTSEGRRLYDYSSGVLVANLGHNPTRWMARFAEYMKWKPEHFSSNGTSQSDEAEYVEAVTMTAYNAATEVEIDAAFRLKESLQASSGGNRLEQIVWSASGSEAVQKALWACLKRDSSRDLILATRHGFHGKKGLAGAVTGCETDPDRDPRVKFISFPREECDDIQSSSKSFDPAPYQAELDAMWSEHGSKITCLITEPYLGGGGSYHPPKEYLQLLQAWCREHDILFVLDEVQANFGRTGKMYAFEAYGLEPDFVCLGKGLGNGVPVSAAAGPEAIWSTMGYGATSDTWSANPISSAAVLATLDEFENTDVLENTMKLNTVFVEKLCGLKETGLITRVRGEGMVFGIECTTVGSISAEDVAIAVVKDCYLGETGGDGIHLLGPLAGKVIRISPPMTMTMPQAEESLALLHRLIDGTAKRLTTSS